MIVAASVAARDEARAAPPESVIGIAAAAASLFGLSLFLDGPKGDEQHYVSLEAGRFDVVAQKNEANEAGIEFRPGWTLWKFRPLMGIHATTDESFYAFLGGRFDVYFGRRFVVSPSFSFVGYHKGDGKDLGAPGVARSGLDFQYRFDNDMRLGVGFFHMSQGKVLNDYNPGTETVQATFSVPLGMLSGGSR